VLRISGDNNPTKHTKHEGKHEDVSEKVEVEGDLKCPNSHGEDLQVDVVTDLECKVYDEGGSNQPR